MKTKAFSSRRLVHAALFASLLGVVPAANAEEFVWDGRLTNDNWDSFFFPIGPFPSLSNWTSDTNDFPDADDTVMFPGTADRFVVDLNGDRSVLSATFAGGTDYTLNNNTLTLLTGGLTATGTATHTINSNLTLGVGGTFDIGPDAAINLNGVLTSTTNLTQRGGGALTLTADGSTLRQLDIGTTGNGVDSSEFTLDGGSLTLSQDLLVAENGRGVLSILNGGSLSSREAHLGRDLNSPLAEILVSGTDAAGNASTLLVSQDIYLGFFNDATMVISAGGQVINNDTVIERAAITVTGTDANGNASTWNSTSVFSLEYGSTALIEAGGHLTTGFVALSFDGSDSNEIVVTGSDAAGNASTLITNGIALGSSSSESNTLEIRDGGFVSTGDVDINPTRSEFGSNDILVAGVDGFGNHATLAIDGDLEIDGQIFGQSESGTGLLTIQTGGIVTVSGETRLDLDSTVILNGGTFNFGQTTLPEYLAFQPTSGTLAGTISGVELTGLNNVADVGLDALLPSLPDAVDVSGVVVADVINRGLLFGDGVFNAGLINAESSEIEVITGERMRFDGSATTNLGQVTLAGGQVHFTQGFTNADGGLVVGDGGLRADDGTTNDGTMAFSATTRVLGDVTNNAGGLITSSGGTTTFFDDVVNNGEIRTNQDSFTVYFGSVSGNGDTGTGTVIIEGDLKPGFSPGITAYAGNLQFGDDASLLIELAGLTPGTEHDQVTVAGDLTINGELEVALLDGFTPDLNQVFDIITINGTLTGEFDGLTQDALVGNFAGTDLFISYQAGDGNDVALYAVPEPTSLALLGLGGLLAARRRTPALNR